MFLKHATPDLSLMDNTALTSQTWDLNKDLSWLLHP